MTPTQERTMIHWQEDADEFLRGHQAGRECERRRILLSAGKLIVQVAAGCLFVWFAMTEIPLLGGLLG